MKMSNQLHGPTALLTEKKTASVGALWIREKSLAPSGIEPAAVLTNASIKLRQF
jgi:hypothetical protein